MLGDKVSIWEMVLQLLGPPSAPWGPSRFRSDDAEMRKCGGFYSPFFKKDVKRMMRSKKAIGCCWSPGLGFDLPGF